MIYKEERLAGLNDDLVKFVKVLAEKHPVDLFIVQGLRTKAQQAILVQGGHSTTMNSRHLTGHAVDIALVVDKKYVGDDWGLYWPLADSARTVSIETEIPIIWGAIWDTELAKLAGDPEDEYHAYVKRWKASNPQSSRSGPLADGPHFQLPLDKYPS